MRELVIFLFFFYSRELVIICRHKILRKKKSLFKAEVDLEKKWTENIYKINLLFHSPERWNVKMYSQIILKKYFGVNLSLKVMNMYLSCYELLSHHSCTTMTEHQHPFPLLLYMLILPRPSLLFYTCNIFTVLSFSFCPSKTCSIVQFFFLWNIKNLNYIITSKENNSTFCFFHKAGRTTM